MAISVETLAAAKKYADKVADSGGGGSAVVADGSITEAKLSSDDKKA